MKVKYPSYYYLGQNRSSPGVWWVPGLFSCQLSEQQPGN